MTGQSPVPTLTSDDLFERYEAFLIDAYGVLVHANGSFEGGRKWLAKLQDSGLPYCILTNAASQPSFTYEKYIEKGVHIPLERIITSGSLMVDYFVSEGLSGSRCLVTGRSDLAGELKKAGAEVLDHQSDALLDDELNVDCLVIGDYLDHALLATADRVLTLLYRHFDAGKEVRMLLPNPDLIYPAGGGRFGFTSGTLALMFEKALELRYGRPFPFEAMGKPSAMIYEAGIKRLRALQPDLPEDIAKRCVMLGDQLHTDVLGARRFGIDVGLVETGVNKATDPLATGERRPTFRIAAM